MILRGYRITGSGIVEEVLPDGRLQVRISRDQVVTATYLDLDKLRNEGS